MLGLGTAVNRGGFVGGAAPAARLLDTFSGAAAAYSLRLLSNSYSGNAVKVRRASDNAELDIGFSSGELDTSALTTHCGSSDGFVVTWYDQSSSNNATQSTTANQPKIYDGTTGVVTKNEKPAMTTGFLTNTFGSAISQPISIYSVHTETTGTNYYHTGSSGKIDLYGFGGAYKMQANTGQVIGPTRSPLFNVQILMLNLYNGANSLIGYNGGNNTTGTLDTNGTSGITLRFGALERQEFIIFEDDDTDRTGIETNINTFYDIY